MSRSKTSADELIQSLKDSILGAKAAGLDCSVLTEALSNLEAKRAEAVSKALKALENSKDWD